MTKTEDTDPQAVLAFWKAAGFDRWFKKDAEFDRAMSERFGALHAEAAAGGKADWSKTPEGALALVLLLDQFSRNMLRGKPEMFAQDPTAREVAGAAIKAGFDKAVQPELAMFFHMPFMHSEAIADQELSLLYFHSLGVEAALAAAREHSEIIRRFGRFPHRNAVLGRHTTPAERAYLDGGGFAG